MATGSAPLAEDTLAHGPHRMLSRISVAVTLQLGVPDRPTPDVSFEPGDLVVLASAGSAVFGVNLAVVVELHDLEM